MCKKCNQQRPWLNKSKAGWQDPPASLPTATAPPPPLTAAGACAVYRHSPFPVVLFSRRRRMRCTTNMDHPEPCIQGARVPWMAAELNPIRKGRDTSQRLQAGANKVSVSCPCRKPCHRSISLAEGRNIEHGDKRGERERRWGGGKGGTTYGIRSDPPTRRTGSRPGRDAQCCRKSRRACRPDSPACLATAASAEGPTTGPPWTVSARAGVGPRPARRG